MLTALIIDLLVVASTVGVIGRLNADMPSRKFDQLSDMAWSEASARLDNYIIQLQNEPGARSVVVIHGTKQHRANAVAKWAACIYGQLVNHGHIDANRIDIRRGETRNHLTIELWLSVRVTPSDPFLKTVTLNQLTFQNRRCGL